MKLITILTTLLLGIFVFSCQPKSEEPLPADPNPPIVYTATLSGQQETPPNQSQASGTATFYLNQYTKIFYGSVTIKGLIPTAGHIHKGVPGVAGPVVFPFNIPNTSDTKIDYNSKTAIDSTQIAALDSGLYYVNIHTAAFPNGEIRGQLIRVTK